MDGYKELLAKLNGLVNMLESGELSMEELNEMEEITRSLHERSIILRYKAYESGISTKLDDRIPTKLDDSKSTEADEGILIENDKESEVEEERAAQTQEEEKEQEVTEETAFDFDMFDTENDASTSLETADEVTTEEVNSEEISAVEPPKAEETNIETPDVPESHIEVSPVESIEVPDNKVGNSFLDQLAVQDNSLASRFSTRPLDSLIGAFGLNERLRFINDLFDGSSEKFSDAIKALDSQNDLNSARLKAAGYAEENNWDPEEEVVAEFMNYLNRRYA